MEPELIKRIAGRDARIAVVGVGYVGLPLAVRFVEKGFPVIGNDVNPDVIKELKAGKRTIEGISGERLKRANRKGLELVAVDRQNPAATNPEILGRFVGVDVFIVCVPTPLDQEKGWEPDTSYMQKAYRMIEKICQMENKAGKLPQERLVVLESTTYPGTTKEIFFPLLRKFGRHGRQWYLAYSPERTSPGPSAYKDKKKTKVATDSGEERHPGTFQITRIVGGVNEESQEIGAVLYETIFRKVRPVSNLETAEMIKLVENTFRFTAIAFANEMALVAKKFGLNIWEIIDAARTKGFGFELCFPGLIGGHCLPIDPHYLTSATRKRRLPTFFVDEAERTHQNMRREAFDLIQRLLNQQNKGIARASILFFGVSYKKNIGDIRESAAIKLMEDLYKSGARISFWDPVRARHPARPHVGLFFTEEQKKGLPKETAAKLEWDSKKKKYCIEPEELIGDWKSLSNRILSSGFNCIVLATDHDDFRSAYAELIKDAAPHIADLSNAIGQWLQKVTLAEDEKQIIKERLAERSKYMLLGVD